ncbi:hypothetical protein COO92_21360 [Thalassospira lohafexi]|uniref:Uncharacterized protein n=1 Tax=Thalassospira lohafexi TaxID=744227 RepID=A0A2N3L0V8_9PROT|nr:hypothetical protein COO92_21360 [Thalassospira lohafexi]
MFGAVMAITDDLEFDRRDSDRHKMRGFMHSVWGRHDYAAGSYLKMLKFQRKADAFRSAFDLWWA